VLVHTPQAHWAVTVADQEGTTVTLALQAGDLQTYQCFQAAVLRETGCRFQYLPWGAPQPPAEPMAPHRSMDPVFPIPH
jgi:hypothetical protein